MKRIMFALICVAAVANTRAQGPGKIFFTTAGGLISGQGNFGKAFKSTIAFNSGVELTLRKNWYTQLLFDFNALRYDQRIRDVNSPFLFQNTNSSLLLLGVNMGKNLDFQNSKWFMSYYAGGGYLNVGEPRITLDPLVNIVKQEAVRKSDLFGRAGARIAYKTKSLFFQTVFFDASYWVSPARVQDGNVRGFSFYIGTRFGVIP